MKKLVIIILFLPTLAFSQNNKDLLNRIDSLVSFKESDFTAEYEIKQILPGEGTRITVSAVFRRDKDEKYAILVMKPSKSRGQGYLKIGRTLWFYDPDSRRFNSTSSKDRFQNSNARNSDFTQSTLAEDYDIVSSSNGKLGKHTCTIFELEANNDEVTYPFMKIWVNSENLVLKTEDYSLSKQLLRTTAIPSYKQISENKYFADKIYIIDNLRGKHIEGKFVHEKTIITISKPTLKDIPNSVFSKSFLERASQ